MSVGQQPVIASKQILYDWSSIKTVDYLPKCIISTT